MASVTLEDCTPQASLQMWMPIVAEPEMSSCRSDVGVDKGVASGAFMLIPGYSGSIGNVASVVGVVVV